MKRLLLFVGVLAMLASCQQKPVNELTLTGTILNPDGSVLMLLSQAQRDTIELAEDGTFTLIKEGERSLYGTLSYGRKRASVWLAPGQTLEVTADVNNWDATLAFSGDLKLPNEYLAEKGLVQMGWGANYMANFMLPPDAFRAKRDSLQGVFTDLLEDYKGKGLDRAFSEKEEIALMYTRYGDLNNYPRAHQYYTKVDEVQLPDDWFDFTETMDLNDPLLVEVDQAMYFLSSWINAEAPKAAQLGEDAWGTPELLAAKFDFIDERFTLPEMVEKFRFDNLDQHLDSGPPTGAEELIDNYLNTTANEENKQVITEKVAGWAAIEAGQQAPGWTLPDINGDMHSLTDFAGKYVYIDFWATWCGPCLAEIPEYRKLVAEYAGRNVQFISISVDRDKPKWEEMVNEEQFEWLQLHDAMNMNDDYLVRFIPTFVLIDREGKILNPRAPRPSEQKLRDLLEAQEGL